jgi:hypothetical protein
MSDMSQPRPEQWLSFEMRMRQRRFARCIAHAGAALDSGDLAGAEAAIEEARQLQRDSPELTTLDARLAALRPLVIETREPAAADPVDADPIEPAEAATAPAAPRRRLTPWIATAAGLAVLAAGTAYGVRYWTARPAQRAAEPVARAQPRVQPPPPAAADVTPANQLVNRLRIVYETVRAPEVAPRLVAAEPRLPAYPGPPIAEPEPEPEPEPVMMAVNRGENNPATPDTKPPLETRPELRLDPVAPPPIAEPPARAIVPPGDPVVLPAARSAPPPAVEEASNTMRDESSVVRSVLRRYESAYSNLDAAEASAVWPAVNRGKLARAFEGLASQRVSLGSCDVTVNGVAARAVCSGSATWEPKVGGGLRTEPRRWSFDLLKSGEAWRIERALAIAR